MTWQQSEIWSWNTPWINIFMKLSWWERGRIKDLGLFEAEYTFSLVFQDSDLAKSVKMCKIVRINQSTIFVGFWSKKLYAFHLLLLLWPTVLPRPSSLLVHDCLDHPSSYVWDVLCYLADRLFLVCLHFVKLIFHASVQSCDRGQNRWHAMFI